MLFASIKDDSLPNEMCYVISLLTAAYNNCTPNELTMSIYTIELHVLKHPVN